MIPSPPSLQQKVSASSKSWDVEEHVDAWHGSVSLNGVNVAATRTDAVVVVDAPDLMPWNDCHAPRTDLIAGSEERAMTLVTERHDPILGEEEANILWIVTVHIAPYSWVTL